MSLPRSGLLVVLLAALAGVPARAGEIATIKGSAGLGGLCRPGRWTPVRVEIDYRGDDAAGDIVVDWGGARVRRAISLASTTRKQVELYIRTADPRDTIVVRLLGDGREIAAAELPVRLVPPSDPLVVCVAAPASWPTGGRACSVTMPVDALPRSWRGYGAADELKWEPAGKPALSAEQSAALNQWRTVQAIEEAETLSPHGREVVAPAHALRRAGTTLLLYAAAFGIIVWPITGIRSRSLFVYPAVVVLAAAGSAVAVAAGHFGRTAVVRVAQSAVIEQVAGARGAFVIARAVAEFPALDAIELRAVDVDGAIALRSGTERRELRFDENGAPIVAGTYGLGATTAFELEAATSFQPLRVDSSGATVQVTNTSAFALRACRFGPGFSRSDVGALAPGQSVEAEHRSDEPDAVFSCAVDAPVVKFAESERRVESEGDAVILLRFPDRRPTP